MKTLQLTKNQMKKVSDAVAEYLALGEEVKKLQNAQKKLMAEVIEPFALQYKHMFRENKYEFDSGYILIGAGRTKLVTHDGKSVNKQLKQVLVKRLPGEVVKQEIDLTALEKAIETNPIVRKALEEFDVELLRTPSIQVKPYKPRKA